MPDKQNEFDLPVSIEQKLNNILSDKDMLNNIILMFKYKEQFETSGNLDSFDHYKDLRSEVVDSILNNLKNSDLKYSKNLSNTLNELFTKNEEISQIGATTSKIIEVNPKSDSLQRKEAMLNQLNEKNPKLIYENSPNLQAISNSLLSSKFLKSIAKPLMSKQVKKQNAKELPKLQANQKLIENFTNELKGLVLSIIKDDLSKVHTEAVQKNKMKQAKLEAGSATRDLRNAYKNERTKNMDKNNAAELFSDKPNAKNKTHKKTSHNAKKQSIPRR